jgi:hypothetical protein
MSDAAALLQGTLVAWAAAAAGRRLVRALVPDAAEDERRVLGFPLGLALLAGATATLLFARLPVVPGVLALLAGGALWGRREFVAAGREAVAWARETPSLRGGPLLLRGLVLAYAALGLVGCLAPETGWDTGVYHYAIARLRAEQGAMVVRPDIVLSSMPAYLESLYTLGFLLHGEALASLVNFSFYFSGLTLVRLWARRWGDARGELLAALAYLACTFYVLRIGGGDVELGQAVYLGLAAYALFRRREGGSAAWRTVAGAGLGMLLGIKYAGAWPVIALALAWLVVRLRDRAPLRELAADAAVVGGLTALVACPWYLSNLIRTGYPLYPFGADAAPPPAAFHPGQDLAIGFKLGVRTDPVAIVLVGVGAWAAPRRARWVAGAMALSILLLSAYLGLVPSPYTSLLSVVRYSTPAFLPLFAMLAAPAVGSWARRIEIALLAVGVCLTGGAHAVRNAAKLPVVAGRVSRGEFLERRINSYWAMRRAESELAPGRQVLLVEQRAYYCSAPFVTASDFQWFVTFDGIETPAQFRALLDRHSIGAIVFSRADYARTWGFKNLVRRLGPGLAEAGVEEVETRSETTLYRVRELR